jgi:hypothetical protein
MMVCLRRLVLFVQLALPHYCVPFPLLQRLPGHKDSCLTCVALVDEEEGKGSTTSRLFSSGLDGVLLEWDVEHRQPGTAADSLGGAVWQLAPEPGACVKSGGRMLGLLLVAELCRQRRGAQPSRP